MPDRKNDTGRSHLKRIVFKVDGHADTPVWIWSGDIMIDLNSSQALRIPLQTIDVTDYLFIEAGGFREKNPSEWESPLMVMKRG